MQLLPEDIVRKIISYSYLPQPKELLEDIRDFSSTLNKVGNVYYNRWVIDEGESEPEDRNWLANDIIRYITHDNDRIAWLFQSKILCRQLLINTLIESQRHVYMFDKMSAEHELRRYWGLMIPKERHEMMCQFATDW